MNQYRLHGFEGNISIERQGNYMTAKELDKLVKELRNYFHVETRMELETKLGRLAYCFGSIGKHDFVEELEKLITEIDSINTEDIVEIGTFN